MDNVNRTLFIPLYGKACVSRKGIILRDPKAEEIWGSAGIELKGKSRSRWLAYYMGMRAAVVDDWAKEKCLEYPDAIVVHIGCGLDSRVMRVGAENEWFDVDFPEVIDCRRRFFQETHRYHLLGADVREENWLDPLPGGKRAIVVMEGVSMYLLRKELVGLLTGLRMRFSQVCLLADCYTEFAAKASRYKNPINDVGVTRVYGLDDPLELGIQSGYSFVQEHEMTPARLTDQLTGAEREIFRTLYGGAVARKMYRLYEFECG